MRAITVGVYVADGIGQFPLTNTSPNSHTTLENGENAIRFLQPTTIIRNILEQKRIYTIWF
jgi:hypothetical protein